jgi:glycosyltransferase involved in cell wall biosynthesis
MLKIASSDVILFPSLRDGGGTVVIEAMSVGKPVVCLDIGGPGLHVTEQCGIKLSPAEPAVTVSRLADALERLYQDEDLRIQLGKAARERADTMYRWDRLGERLMEIYRPLLTNESQERDST